VIGGAFSPTSARGDVMGQGQILKCAHVREEQRNRCADSRCIERNGRGE